MTRKKQRKDLSEHEAHITGFSHDGRGIARIDGKIIFIDGALPNEAVRFHYTKKRSSFDEGITTQILSPAAERVTPKCPHFGVCGGCSLQHIDTNTQINYKQQAFLELLKHQAGISPDTILPALTGNPWGYRSKARLGVKFVAGKNKVLVGFREKQKNFVANLETCETLHPSIGKKIADMSTMLYQLEQKDQIAQIEIAVDDHSAALIIRHLVELPKKDLELLSQFGAQHHFKIYLQPKGPETIHLIFPTTDELMQYSLPDYSLQLKFHPRQFTQINASINQKMLALALKLLELSPKDRVLDLFCGIGNFTLPIARYCDSVIGVEGDASAVAQAKDNANFNNVDNAEFFTANLFEPLQDKNWVNCTYDKVMLDPPRSGANEIIQYFKSWKPQRIVYVSCNPATLARDTKDITAQGYRLEKAGVMDMFPHTQHVEAIALFVKN